MNILRNNYGFSLIETLVVIAVIALIAVFSIPLMQTYYSQNELKVAVDGTTQSLRRAQSYATSQYQDSNWGVHLETGKVVVFIGNSYATRTQTFDEITTFGNFIDISGTTDIVFTKFSGSPSSTGSITLSIDPNNSKTISINSKGTVSY